MTTLKLKRWQFYIFCVYYQSWRQTLTTEGQDAEGGHYLRVNPAWIRPWSTAPWQQDYLGSGVGRAQLDLIHSGCC